MPEVTNEVKWHVTTRPYSYAYEEDGEHMGSAFAEIRKERGFETTEEFSEWVFKTTQDEHGQYGYDAPACLLDAFEHPSLGWESGMYVIEGVAQALNVSPGTLLDELHLRASGRYREDGSQMEGCERHRGDPHNLCAACWEVEA